MTNSKERAIESYQRRDVPHEHGMRDSGNRYAPSPFDTGRYMSRENRRTAAASGVSASRVSLGLETSDQTNITYEPPRVVYTTAETREPEYDEFDDLTNYEEDALDAFAIYLDRMGIEGEERVAAAEAFRASPEIQLMVLHMMLDSGLNTSNGKRGDIARVRRH